MINATPIGSPVAQPTPTSTPQTSAPTLNPVESAVNQKPAKPKKKFNWKMILGGLLLLILVAGAGVGLFLSQQSQDIRQQASGNCPGAEIECNDACGWRCLTPGQGKTCENTCSATPPAPPAQTTQPAATNVCKSGSASACTDVPIGNLCRGFNSNYYCLKNGTNAAGEPICGCVIQNKLANGSACDINDECQSGSCIAKVCVTPGATIPDETKTTNKTCFRVSTTSKTCDTFQIPFKDSCTTQGGYSTQTECLAVANTKTSTTEGNTCPPKSVKIASGLGCECYQANNARYEFGFTTTTPTQCVSATCTAGSYYCNGNERRIYTSTSCASSSVQVCDGGCENGQCKTSTALTCPAGFTSTRPSCTSTQSEEITSVNSNTQKLTCYRCVNKAPTCTAGSYYCNGNERRIYTSTSCASSSVQVCDGGCENGQCKTSTPTPVGQCQKVNTTCATGSSPVDDQSCSSLKTVQPTVYTGKMCKSTSTTCYKQVNEYVGSTLEKVCRTQTITSGTCASNGFYSSETACKSTLSATNCFTTTDKCVQGNPQNCELSTSYSTQVACLQSLNATATTCTYDSNCPTTQVCRSGKCVNVNGGGQYGCITCNGLNCTYTCSTVANLACFSCTELRWGRCMTNQTYSGQVSPNQSVNLAQLVANAGADKCWHQCDWNNAGSAASAGDIAAKTFYSCGGQVTPPNIPADQPGQPPAQPAITYGCNATCTADTQCQDTTKGGSAGLFCSSGKCRLRSNPTSESCQPSVGPMCLNVTMTNLTAATRTTPKIGDQVQFTCGTVSGATSYVFRVLVPGIPDPISLNPDANANVGNKSAPFKITAAGTYKAQCQICTNIDQGKTCLPWEPLQ